MGPKLNPQDDQIWNLDRAPWYLLWDVNFWHRKTLHRGYIGGKSFNFFLKCPKIGVPQSGKFCISGPALGRAKILAFSVGIRSKWFRRSIENELQPVTSSQRTRIFTIGVMLVDWILLDWTLNWRWRSFKVSTFDAIWNPTYDFLLVINCQLSSISHHFWDIASWSPKNTPP